MRSRHHHFYLQPVAGGLLQPGGGSNIITGAIRSFLHYSHDAHRDIITTLKKENTATDQIAEPQLIAQPIANSYDNKYVVIAAGLQSKPFNSYLEACAYARTHYAQKQFKIKYIAR